MKLHLISHVLHKIIPFFFLIKDCKILIRGTKVKVKI